MILKNFTTLLLTLCLMSSQTQAQNNALSFNGTNTYVGINTGTNSLTGTFTVEFMMKPNTLKNCGIFGTRGPSEVSFDIQLTASGGLHSDIGNGSSWLATNVNTANNVIPVNTWSHIAFVVTTSSWTIYVNGVQSGTGTFSGTPLLYNSTHTMTIGTYALGVTGSNLDGVIDELRVWNVARTQSQIQTNKNLELSSGTGLVAAYHFNQGVGSGNNAGITTLMDAMGSSNGTLSNFALTGSTSNWVVSNAPLPVELLSFEGKSTEKGNLLTWRTASEINNKGFELEISTNPSMVAEWHTLGFVAPKSSAKAYSETKGASNDYEFVDKSPLGMNYYRLKQLDYNGTYTYSKTIAVQSSNKTNLKIYPSVSTSFLNVESAESEGNYFIFNFLGQQVLMGKTTQTIDISTLPKGAYILKVGNAQAKFMKQ